MFELGEIKKIVEQIAEARQLQKKVLWEVIENALGAAYKREYAKSEQIIRARVNRETGETQFFQVKRVLDASSVLPEGEKVKDEEDDRVTFNPERHILHEDAKLVSAGIGSGEELFFELEGKSDFGRIAAQSARQAIAQSIYQAERSAALDEFKDKEGTLAQGRVQRIERGNIFLDLGRTVAILPFSEQIRGERFRQGERVRVYIASVDPKRKGGGFVMVSRADPNFVKKLFELEVPELLEGGLEIKKMVRETGVRTKIAVESSDPNLDPIGSLVGQRGVRIMAVKSELSGEQIDIIPWSSDEAEFVGKALSPAEVLEVAVEGDVARVRVSDDQIRITVGRGGQNLRLASKLTDKKIILTNVQGEEVAMYPNEEGEVAIMCDIGDENKKQEEREEASEKSETAGEEVLEEETTEKPDSKETDKPSEQEEETKENGGEGGETEDEDTSK